MDCPPLPVLFPLSFIDKKTKAFGGCVAHPRPHRIWIQASRLRSLFSEAPRVKTRTHTQKRGWTHNTPWTERVSTVLVPSVDSIPSAGERWPNCRGDKHRALLLTKTSFNEILSGFRTFCFSLDNPLMLSFLAYSVYFTCPVSPWPIKEALLVCLMFLRYKRSFPE